MDAVKKDSFQKPQQREKCYEDIAIVNLLLLLLL